MDLFAYGGLYNGNFASSWRDGLNRTNTTQAAKAICQEIQNRAFDFFNLDSAFNTIDNVEFIKDPNAGRGRTISRSKEDLANFIAYFCKENGIIWDDISTNKTTYEMDAFRKTILGRALWDAECFASQIGKASANTSTTPSSTPRAASTRTPGQPPKNPYKQSGPQSSKVRDLIGTPGQKITTSAGRVFKIVGDNQNAQKFNAVANIKPLSKNGAAGNTNKVFIGSAQGYTDCVCYFDNQIDANNFLAKCQAICPPNVVNLHLIRMAPDSNGYFQVGTEFGPVWVSARTLNEAITEAANEEAAKATKVKTFPSIKDIDAYTEAFYKYE